MSWESNIHPMSLTPHLRVVRRTLLAFAIFTFSSLAHAVNALRRFDVPAGDAARTLPLFAEQADREIVFSLAAVKGARTNAVSGELTASEALSRLVAGTGLAVTRDTATGAFAVRAERSIPNAERTAPAPAANRPLPAAPSNSEVIELSAFVTKADSGWIGSSSLIGSRTNEEIANLPLSIDAITSEFMKDTNSLMMEDAGRWIAGFEGPSNMVLSRNDNDTVDPVSYRGMVVGDRQVGQSTRNFFLWYAPTDTYNVDRIDFNKGSNSIMFGDASPGGQTSTYTKQARFNNFAEFIGQYGSYDSYRAQLDINRKLTDRLALRLNLVQRANHTYTNFSEQGFRAADLAVTYRPTQTTIVRVEAEGGEFNRHRSDNTIAVLSNPAPGRGFNTNNRWYYTSDGAIIPRNAANPLPAVDTTGPGGTTLSLLDGQSQDIRLPSGAIKRFTGFDKAFNILGTQNNQDRNYTVVSAWVEQRIGKLSLEAAYNQQNTYQVRNDSTFPTTFNVDGAGRPYVDMGWDKKVFGNRVKIGRLTAAYPFSAGKWLRQYLVATFGTQRDYNYSERLTLANFAALTPGQLAPNHQIITRAYLDSPDVNSDAFWDRLSVAGLPRTAAFQPGWYETTDVNRPFVDIRYQRTQSATLSGNYFNGRLRSLLGVRHDALSRKRITRIPVDAIGQQIYLGDPDAVPDAYSYDPQFALSSTIWNGGLSYTLFKNLNVYGSYSESFRWQSGSMFDGPFLPPVTGETKEVGIKGAILDGKLTYTASVYRIDRLNSSFAWSPDILTPTQLEDLINPNNVLPGDPKYTRVATGLNNEHRTVLSSERSKGYDLTLQLQRIRGVQARFTFSHNDISSQRDMSTLAAYLKAATDRTAAANAAGGNPALAEQALLITNANTILAANLNVPAVTGSRSRPNAANLLLDYEFARDTRFRGLRVAVGGNWRSAYNLGIINGVPITGNPTFPVMAYAIYRKKILGHSASFRLGVENAYDLINGNSPYRRTGIYNARPDGSLNYSYRYLDPTTWNLTTTVSF